MYQITGNFTIYFMVGICEYDAGTIFQILITQCF